MKTTSAVAEQRAERTPKGTHRDKKEKIERWASKNAVDKTFEGRGGGICQIRTLIILPEVIIRRFNDSVSTNDPRRSIPFSWRPPRHDKEREERG